MSEITELLLEGNGAPNIDAVFQRLYPELKKLAGARLAGSGGNLTLSATSLVNEAYLKFVGSEQLSLENRRHFFACAGRAMRQVVIDYARRRQAVKRGSEITLVNSAWAIDALGEADASESLLALEQALHALADREPRLVQLIELRVFAGLDQGQCAALLGCSFSSGRTGIWPRPCASTPALPWPRGIARGRGHRSNGHGSPCSNGRSRILRGGGSCGNG